MVAFALNHMSLPNHDWRALLDTAAELGCVGVEFRNDLATPLFGGEPAATVAAEARARGLRVLGLSQVYPFNRWSDATRDAVADLVETAQACGAESISLIPLNDGTGGEDGPRQRALRYALQEIRPLVEGSGLIALIEPLGFTRSSLRSKSETIEAIEAVASRDQFRIVHDTFHHCLAGGGPIFAGWTGLVHISGVSDPAPALSEMEDAHRVLVDADDRLGNLDQIAALIAAGYDGPLSMEAFSPAFHASTNPVAALGTSFDFIRDRLIADETR